MDNDSKTTVGPKLQRMMRTSNTRTVKDDTTRRTAARKAYRAKIESLLDESRDERLADVWQRLYPLPIDPASELPECRGIIEDLADFAEALDDASRGIGKTELFPSLIVGESHHDRTRTSRSETNRSSN